MEEYLWVPWVTARSWVAIPWKSNLQNCTSKKWVPDFVRIRYSFLNSCFGHPSHNLKIGYLICKKWIGCLKHLKIGCPIHERWAGIWNHRAFSIRFCLGEKHGIGLVPPSLAFVNHFFFLRHLIDNFRDCRNFYRVVSVEFFDETKTHYRSSCSDFKNVNFIVLLVYLLFFYYLLIKTIS